MTSFDKLREVALQPFRTRPPPINDLANHSPCKTSLMHNLMCVGLFHSSVADRSADILRSAVAEGPVSASLPRDHCDHQNARRVDPAQRKSLHLTPQYAQRRPSSCAVACRIASVEKTQSCCHLFSWLSTSDRRERVARNPTTEQQQDLNTEQQGERELERPSEIQSSYDSTKAKPMTLQGPRTT